MNHKRKNGFVLFLVIGMIGLFASLMMVQSLFTHELARQTNRLYLRSVHNNMYASAESWLKKHPESISPEATGLFIPLDTQTWHDLGTTTKHELKIAFETDKTLIVEMKSQKSGQKLIQSRLLSKQ